MKNKLFCLLLVCIGLTIGANAQLKASRATVWYTEANNWLTASSGATPAVTINTADTINALFRADYLSTIYVEDSFLKTSGTVGGTCTLYGTNDTTGGGVWFTLRADTTVTTGTKVGAYTVTNTTGQVAVWVFKQFPFLYGKASTISSGGIFKQKLRVWGKW